MENARALISHFLKNRITLATFLLYLYARARLRLGYYPHRYFYLMMPTLKKVLVIGSGAREHALVQACLKSLRVQAVVAAPGNGGMAQEVPCLPLDVENVPQIVELAKSQGADFVVVGPEVPLSLGAVDALETAGIPAYGPQKAGARLEASKTFTKDFLLKYKIPTAFGEKFTDVKSALDFLKTQSFPIVIKASGLAAGKGVVIPQNFDEAEQAVREMLEQKIFGDSGAEILIEEFMDGEEASIMLMVSGTDFVELSPSQDHKRVGDGDTGPNTGGMGAYAPAAVVTPEINEQVLERIVKPTLAGLKQEGIDYRGTLYVGIMITAQGPKVVEFNVRFGDPECEILLPLLETDVVQLMWDCAHGTLQPETVRFKNGYAVIVVLAAKGYPGAYAKGEKITLPFPCKEESGVQILHAGTKLNEHGDLLTNGGRVLGVVAQAPTLPEAVKKAYETAELIHFDSKYLRTDIAHRELKRLGL